MLVFVFLFFFWLKLWLWWVLVPVTVLMVSFMLPLVVAELRQLLSDQIAHLSELVESYLADLRFLKDTGRYVTCYAVMPPNGDDWKILGVLIFWRCAVKHVKLDDESHLNAQDWSC